MALLKVVSRCSSTSSTTATGTGQICFQHQSPNSISWKSVENWEKAPTLSRVYTQTTERPGLFYFPSVSLDIIQNIISEFVTAKHDAFILIQLTVTNPIIFSSVCSRGQRQSWCWKCWCSVLLHLSSWDTPRHSQNTKCMADIELWHKHVRPFGSTCQTWWFATWRETADLDFRVLVAHLKMSPWILTATFMQFGGNLN